MKILVRLWLGYFDDMGRVVVEEFGEVNMLCMGVLYDGVMVNDLVW